MDRTHRGPDKCQRRANIDPFVERCHLASVRDTLAYQEKEVLYTREGTDGVRQVDARGLIAVSFTHRDSRAGDPDLHTHVAITNKAQTLEGRWHTADSRMFFKAHVPASETYDTFLRAHLTATLGVSLDLSSGGVGSFRRLEDHRVGLILDAPSL